MTAPAVPFSPDEASDVAKARDAWHTAGSDAREQALSDAVVRYVNGVLINHFTAPRTPKEVNQYVKRMIRPEIIFRLADMCKYVVEQVAWVSILKSSSSMFILEAWDNTVSRQFERSGWIIRRKRVEKRRGRLWWWWRSLEPTPEPAPESTPESTYFILSRNENMKKKVKKKVEAFVGRKLDL